MQITRDPGEQKLTKASVADNRPTLPISVLILTKNEEANLPGCLETVTWSDDIHVLDSFSDDGTLRIADAFGVNISQRVFDSFSAHQNWALQNLPFRYPWVFYLDADERATPELISSMKAAVENPGEAVGFRIQRRDFFMGTWLKHVQASPYYIRLFRTDKMRYERLGHPVSLPEGPVGQITGYLDHYPFSKGIAQWIERHNFYSTQEAEQIHNNRRTGENFSVIKAFTCKDFHQRRYHQKELFYRLPCRPLFKFTLLYGLKRGFLDGRAGFRYAILQSMYEYLIVMKVHERERLTSLDSPIGTGKK